MPANTFLITFSQRNNCFIGNIYGSYKITPDIPNLDLIDAFEIFKNN